MFAPNDLPSSDSLDGLSVETPEDKDPSRLVCSASCSGARCAPHCAQRFATARWFLATLLTLALLLGAARGYLAALAHVIGERYALPASAVDWLLVGAEASQGATALMIAHHGARAHRPSWLGAPAFLHAGALFVAFVPFVTEHGVQHGLPERNITEWLCHSRGIREPESIGSPCWMILTALVVVQLTAGIASSALLTHGITYLDDNVVSTDSPSLIGAVLGADRLGPPLGHVFAYLCATASGSATGHVVAGGHLSGVWWIGWPVLGSMLVVIALLISMFPVRLPAAAVRERANCILNKVCGRVRIDAQPSDIDSAPGLFPTLFRLITNKALIFLTLFLMFLYIPLYNFGKYENRYLESVYFIPEPEYSGGVFKDQWISRVTTGFLKPPIVLMTMLLSGMIIARKHPRPSALALWNVGMVLMLAAIFLSFSFLGCASSVRGLGEKSLQLTERCNSACSCSENTPFLPVCDRNDIQTYYSPCHAGCERVEYLDNIKLYHDCKCLLYDRRAKAGACTSNCTSKWVIFQSLGVLIAGLIGSCLVGSILLCLRSVENQDKTAAIGFVLMNIGITHLPGKFIYKVATDATCVYWGESNYNCQLFDPQLLPFAFNLLTVGFLLFAFFFGMFAWTNSKHIKLFYDQFDEPDEIEMNEIRRKLNARLSTPFLRRKRRSVNDDSEEEGEGGRVETHRQSVSPLDAISEIERQPLNQVQIEDNGMQRSSDSEDEIENSREITEIPSDMNNVTQNNVGSRRVWRATLI